MSMRSNGGLVSALLDFSFEDLLTPKIIKLSYGLTLGLIGLGACLGLLLVLGGFLDSPLLSLGLLLFVAGVTVVCLIGARMAHEAAVLFFAIGTHTRELAEHGAQIALNTALGRQPRVVEEATGRSREANSTASRPTNLEP